ncbi:type III PLP-dependent enzyme domain-containing protein [Sporosarcina sp. CAU 1771]
MEKAYAHLSRPFACIDLNALDRNISFMNRASRGKKIRIATKSVRSIEMLKYIADRVPNHSGWMTFDLKETSHLLNSGFDNLLIGYPQLEVGPMSELIEFIKRGRTVIFMVDTYEHWLWLEKIGEHHKTVLEICVDLNLSTDFKLIYFGTKRSSLSTIKDVRSLMNKTKSFRYTKLSSVMGYEAQIAGVPDLPNLKWQAPLIKLMKKRSYKRIRVFRKNSVKLIHRQVGSLRFVNGGGSGSVDFTSREDEVTEITIGSAYYFSALFSRYKNLPLEPATAFALRVTRKPTKNVVVCHGGGYIASGTVGEDKNPVPVWPSNLSLLKNEGAGEVQTPLYDKDEVLKIGETVYFRHAKAGELCERFPELHARRGAQYVGSFTTYRGDGGCYL